MIHNREKSPSPEPFRGRPVASGDDWLGRGKSDDRRRLWEHLSPPHRRQLRILARALALRQGKARLSEDVRSRLLTALGELDRLSRRIEQLLAALTKPTTPPG